jgi:hypothetical protein
VPSGSRKCADTRAIFEFSAENAKIADCLAEGVGFEPTRDFHPCPVFKFDRIVSTGVQIKQSHAVVSPPPTLFRTVVRALGGQGGGRSSMRGFGPDLEHQEPLIKRELPASAFSSKTKFESAHLGEQSAHGRKGLESNSGNPQLARVPGSIGKARFSGPITRSLSTRNAGEENTGLPAANFHLSVPSGFTT